MNLNYLSYFDVLGQYEHYGKAADALHITQPSLSQTIARLEEELGVVLFERSGRGIRLTKAGHRYWKRVNYAIKELELAGAELQQSVNETAGCVDIGFTFVVGSVFVPVLLREFLKLPGNEHVRFSTIQGDSPEIIVMLKNRKCDVGFCSLYENEPDIEFVPIYRQELVLITAVDHPLSKKNVIQCDDIVQYPFICFKDNHTLRKEIDHIFTAQSLSIRPLFEVTEETAMAGLVSSGLGIAIAPYSHLLNIFPLEKRHIAGIPSSRCLYMAVLRHCYQTPAVKRFVEFAVKQKQAPLHL